MKTIFKALFLLIALSAVPVFAQSDFESTKARAEAGDADSQAALGNIYFDGAGIPQNYKEAFNWYSLAAKDGWFNGAQFRLGYLYYNGLGVSKNLVKAYAWFSVAAAQGDTTAKQRRDRY